MAKSQFFNLSLPSCALCSTHYKPVPPELTANPIFSTKADCDGDKTLAENLKIQAISA